MNRALALVDPSEESRSPGTTDAAAIARPLLETKLYAPRSPGRLVPRPRLSSVLLEREAHRLTLVSAPAGFGKSTLLGELVGAASGNVAWVSLDAGDNDPWLFWAYVSSALQTTPPGPAHVIRQRDVNAFVTTLINEVAADGTDRLLILDDYHVIDESSVHDSVALLLDRLPPRMHVVIASRSVPPIGLSRLRARGELLELRADDLRFTADEAGTFFKQVMSLELTTTDVAALGRRTEGWIAGLKLAALSMKGRSDPGHFVASFSGENRHVADYLVEEVLHSEPERVRDFLLATSILDRLSGPLCDAVTGESGSQAMLEDLERRNLFVVPLDDRRGWYRYHHLFAEVLQRRSTSAPALHARASEWFATQGAIADAIGHAIKSGDAARTACLLERHWPEKDRSYESANWLSRVRALPEDVIRARPVLAMGYAWALLNSGELEAANLRLRDVEEALQSDPTQLVIGDDARFQSLETELASARIYLAQSRGEIPGTLEHAKRALERIPEHDHTAHATGVALVALAHWGRGELADAHDTFCQALDEMRRADHGLDAIRGMFVPGDVRAAQGRLREAAEIYKHGLEAAARSPSLAGADTGDLYLGLSELHREWNDLATAKDHLDTFTRHQASAAHGGNLQRWYVAMARIHEARGETNRALQLLAEAETHERRDPLPRVRPIPAMRARLELARENMEVAANWARTVSVTMDDEPTYLREFELLTFARLLIRQKHNQTALIAFIDRLRIAAQSGGRIGSVIEVLVLQALAYHAFGNGRASLDALAEAITFAEPEGFLRVFVDEGVQVRDLLRTATARGLAGPYTRRVLAAFDGPTQPAVSPGASESTTPPNQSITARELEILRLIAAGLRNAEIAETLSISQATVKRHIANVYAKLGAEHRTEALVRAAELKLL
jgi:LuxR family maltose regulon positive regulatory protein